LSGASNIALQDICPDAVADHFLIITDVITEFFVLDAFNSSSGQADESDATVADRALLCTDILPQFNSVNGTIGFGEDAFISVLTLGV